MDWLPSTSDPARIVFGKPVNQVTVEDLSDLVTSSAEEFAQLDFKRGRYANDSDAKQKLATAIAAMANALGGVIVLGIREENAVARELLEPFELSEAEEQRMRNVLHSWVSPQVEFGVSRVPTNATGDAGYYVLVVPPSPRAPHSVSRPNEHRMLFPARYGRDTTYLHESELAAAYRDRFTSRDAQATEFDERLQRFRDWVDATTSGRVWLLAAVSPRVRGRMPLTAQAPHELLTWAQTRASLFGVGGLLWFGQHPEVDVGRVRLAGTTETNSGLHSRLAELDDDGAGRTAMSLPVGGPDGAVALYGNQLLAGAVSALDLLCAHAVENAGVWGDALAEVQLFNPSSRAIYLALSRTTRQIQSSASSRQELSVSALHASAGEILMTSKWMLGRIVQAFGVPELQHVTDAGALRRMALEQGGVVSEQTLVDWATRRDVEVVDD